MSERSTPPAERPLDGVRIVECGVWHAGPGANAILADLGAEVIKIEPLTGDPERLYGRFGALDTSMFERPNWNLLFEMSNRNKRGICLDIATPEGHRILTDLVRDADIFLTNMRPSTKTRLGIAYEDLRQANERLIHLSVSGYGAKGDMADVGAFDGMAQAISSMVYLAGRDEPQALQVIVLDQMTAITASHAAITALYARERTGEGQEVHVSLYGSALWLMYANIVQSSVLKTPINTTWERTKNSFSRTTFQCGDGEWIMGTNHPEDRYWVRFCEAVGEHELAADPTMATKEQRDPVNEELIARFDKIFMTRPRAEWLRILTEHGVHFAPVNRIQDVLEDPQALVNGYLTDFEHPHLGTIRIPGFPVQFGNHAAGMHTPAPELGEHTAEVLGELGLTDDQIAGLIERGIVR